MEKEFVGVPYVIVQIKLTKFTITFVALDRLSYLFQKMAMNSYLLFQRLSVSYELLITQQHFFARLHGSFTHNDPDL